MHSWALTYTRLIQIHSNIIKFNISNCNEIWVNCNYFVFCNKRFSMKILPISGIENSDGNTENFGVL